MARARRRTRIPFRRRPRPPRTRMRKRVENYRQHRAERPRKKLPRTIVPSFFTLMNLFCGFLAILHVQQGEMVYAAWLIVLAGFFDLLDGFMARLANATSDFGVELDSLADVVSFGAAPAFLVYTLWLTDLGMLGLLLAGLPVACGAIRLARYNVSFDGVKRHYFNGLPVPAQAMVIVAFVLTFHERPLPMLPDGILSVLVPMLVVLSALMVSTVQFDTLPRPTRVGLRERPWAALLMGLSALLILIFREIGLLIAFVVYILFSTGRALYFMLRDIWRATA